MGLSLYGIMYLPYLPFWKRGSFNPPALMIGVKIYAIMNFFKPLMSYLSWNICLLFGDCCRIFTSWKLNPE
jgi:hypothetical protein